MAIQRITEDTFETFTLETNPKRTYVSSSSGITGSINLFAIRSDIYKDLRARAGDEFIDENIEDRITAIRTSVVSGTTNIKSSIESLLTTINDLSISPRLGLKLDLFRHTSGALETYYNEWFSRKFTLINSIMPYYRITRPDNNFSYANYHCLNFYTASNVPSDSVFLYPNLIDTTTPVSTSYSLSDAFTFDFWIKPKYTTDLPDAGAVYRPGCLLHLSSSYAISIHSGSSRDINGYPDAFKILLQLSSSADVAPDLATPGSGYTFLSDDNVLPIDEWSHVTIKWGGPTTNAGTGSFIVNNVDHGTFTITESLSVGLADNSETPIASGAGTRRWASTLCIGNYYQGTNTGNNSQRWFFSTEPAAIEGLIELVSSTLQRQPVAFNFDYPLNSEVHDIKIYNRYLNRNQVRDLDTNGPDTLNGLRFYLPPFFTYESPIRTNIATSLPYGFTLPLTPFYGMNAFLPTNGQITTTTPFAAEMSKGCGGHFINLENYVRDFGTGNYPRLWSLTASLANTPYTGPIAGLTANDFIYSTGSNIKRLYTIFPNDNGKCNPNFNLLDSLNNSIFVDDLGNQISGYISLRNIFFDVENNRTPIRPGILGEYSGSADPGGNDPNNYAIAPGASLALYSWNTSLGGRSLIGDDTSNQIVIFDISNMFYGNRINPGTLILRDTNLTGSNGKIGFTIRDNEYGSLYRADANGEHPKWASIGNVFYDEGLILLKMPQLYFFGKQEFEIEFEGVQNIHSLTVNAFANPLELITSSYVAYQTGSIDELANVNDPTYVFISNVLLHDNNLNVIGRTSIAQPILKRTADKYLIKLKMDF